MVTDKQVRLLRLKMAEGKTVEAAAAAAGMSAQRAHLEGRDAAVAGKAAPALADS
jgi:putative ubiquitin-RnfH superfamily antitoxin RatB of RatAB toxin-antitoxin module